MLCREIRTAVFRVQKAFFDLLPWTRDDRRRARESASRIGWPTPYGSRSNTSISPARNAPPRTTGRPSACTVAVGVQNALEMVMSRQHVLSSSASRDLVFQTRSAFAMRFIIIILSLYSFVIEISARSDGGFFFSKVPTTITNNHSCSSSSPGFRINICNNPKIKKQ
jgi:hypothetical protein